MSNHTPEPWYAAEARTRGWVIVDGASNFEVVVGSIDDGGHIGPLTQSNARRIVACVNFCAGVSTENLETNESLLWLAEQYNTVKAQRDELLKVTADHDRLVRELDVLLNGEEGAAQQASLCDLVSQLKTKGGAA